MHRTSALRVLCVLLYLVCSAGALFSQGQTFEVASVKRTTQGGPPGDIPRNMDTSPGSFTMRNVPLRFALEWAYDLKDYEISGPDWINSEERYDIVAKAAGPATNDQMRPMLQALLLGRFRMKVHRETRDLPVYVLLAGKGAPKVKPASAGGEPTLSSSAAGTFFHNQPISRLTFMLTRRMDRPVLDMTGLKGVYDYTLDTSGLGFNGLPAADPNAGPSIFTAIQDNLGLQLEARKSPVEILVIDRVEKIPIEN
jgi:uncharacterized protein (TIGR03435 family)